MQGRGQSRFPGVVDVTSHNDWLRFQFHMVILQTSCDARTGFAESASGNGRRFHF